MQKVLFENWLAYEKTSYEFVQSTCAWTRLVDNV